METGGTAKIIRRTARLEEANGYLTTENAASEVTLVISGNITPKPGNFWLERGEYQMPPSLVTRILGMSARCGAG